MAILFILRFAIFLKHYVGNFSIHIFKICHFINNAKSLLELQEGSEICKKDN